MKLYADLLDRARQRVRPKEDDEVADNVREVLGMLKAAFPKQEFNQANLIAYSHGLADLDADRLEQAMWRHVATSRWFPTIADLRILYFEDELALPTPLEAWRDIEETVRLGCGPEAIDDDLARKLARQIGWNAIRHSDRPDVVRSQFLKSYESERAAAVADANARSLGNPRDRVLSPSNANRAAVAALGSTGPSTTGDGE